jgi:glycosyltransferase involved in cell wall biosynthesis
MADELFNSLTVVIPTYNRQGVLAKALEGYLTQTVPQFIRELLVIDDGSTDSTEAMVRDCTSRSPFPVRYLRQSNKGPAAARNLGVREALSRLVLFTDSDVIPKRDLVERHVEWHRQNPDMTAAMLGYLTWASEVNATPFMRWYGEQKLFAFRQLRNQNEADFRCFYTCNLSLKTVFLRTCGQFDEEFKTAAFEDNELGYRLSKQGLRLHYNRAAIGYHDQFFSFETACQKTRANAAASELFFSKEAGQAVLKQIKERQSRPGYALARALAIGTARLLAPVRHILNSSIPLPGIVYHIFFWDSTEGRRLDKSSSCRDSAA